MATYIFHLPYGADEPVVCAHPASCTYGVHVSTIEEAEEMRKQRNFRKQSLPPSLTKADMAKLLNSMQTGTPYFDI